MRKPIRNITQALLFLLLTSPRNTPAVRERADYFMIQVVDAETGRGVPLVELKMTNEVSYYTDSNGIVAFDEPSLMDQEVFFHIKSHGYAYPQDFLGNRGKALKVKRGGSAILKITRVNIAERLYRVTGEGIYRDSVLVGHPVPITHPVLNAKVVGQDTVMAIPYRDKVYWFWGDTDRPSYPLGNFGTSGATSEWPGKGGLDPSVGVDLTYFVDESGFSKSMFPSSIFVGPGPKWIGGLMTINDEKGEQRLIATYERIKSLDEAYERGLAIFNDSTASFDRLARFNLDTPLYPDGRPFRVRVEGEDYYYFSSPFPTPCVRVKADMKHITNPFAYEGLTCLVAGTKYDAKNPKLDRDADGHLVFQWKPFTKPVGYKEQAELIAGRKMAPEEGLLQLRDIETGKLIDASLNVSWNEYRKRWIAIGQRNVGEVWYAEADTPVGPWVYAKKVVSHDRYTFYWPGQHSFFDQDGGRIIYFEGTYTNSFSGNPEKTPRYNYNQMMYRLALSDSRLFLPTPVYRARADDGTLRYLMREQIESENWNKIEEVAFFAFRPDRRQEGLIPIFGSMEKDGIALRTEPKGQNANQRQPLFYVLPAHPEVHDDAIAGTWRCRGKTESGDELPFTLELKLQGETVMVPASGNGLTITKGTYKSAKLDLEVRVDEDSYSLTGVLTQGKLKGTWKRMQRPQGVLSDEKGAWEGERVDLPREQGTSPAVVPLYEYRDASRGTRSYSTHASLRGPLLKRSSEPICRVWQNPMRSLILDRDAKP